MQAADCDAGHLFRGKLFDKFAQIENWASDLLVTHNRKVPLLFGIKLKDVRSLLTQETMLNQKRRDGISALLDSLEPYQTMRAEIGHSTMRAVSDGNERFWAFYPSSPTHPPGVSRPTLVATESSNDILSEIAKIANQLRQQTNPPPSPPRPSPGAAGGP